MFVQGVLLLTGLFLYFRDRPLYTYPILMIGIIATVYLITPGVQVAFLPPRTEIGEVVQGPAIHPPKEPVQEEEAT